ncbi:MAG: hypothetical protein WDM79_00080 [Terricaulis sp.]
MNVTKLRIANEPGLAPAGVYFARLATQLRALNENESARQAALDAEDRRLEARYRAKSTAPVRRRVAHAEVAHAIQ